MFTFRLEPLISIRNNVLKECQAELAKAYHARSILEEALTEVEHQMAEGVSIVRSQTQAGQTVNVNDLLGFRRQEMFLQAQQNDLRQKIHIVDEEINRRRAAVAEANKELKVVEKLKEKRYEKYQEEENKAETKYMDEIAGHRRGQEKHG